MWNDHFTHIATEIVEESFSVTVYGDLISRGPRDHLHQRNTHIQYLKQLHQTNEEGVMLVVNN